MMETLPGRREWRSLPDAKKRRPDPVRPQKPSARRRTADAAGTYGTADASRTYGAADASWTCGRGGAADASRTCRAAEASRAYECASVATDLKRRPAERCNETRSVPKAAHLLLLKLLLVVLLFFTPSLVQLPSSYAIRPLGSAGCVAPEFTAKFIGVPGDQMLRSSGCRLWGSALGWRASCFRHSAYFAEPGFNR